MDRQELRKKFFKTSIYIAIYSALVVVLFPIYWMVTASFQDNSELMASPPKLSPIGGDLENYFEILTQLKYLTYFKNSLIVSAGAVTLCIFVSILAGYSLSRVDFKGKDVLMTFILSGQMFPIVAILMSLYTVYRSLGLLNSYIGLILVDVTLSLPFSIWFLKSFFDTIPKELDEAAAIDGCSNIRTLFQVVGPLAKPGILAVSVYTFMMTWDDFVIALTIMNRDEMRTLPVGIALSFLGEHIHDFAGMMTLSVIASIPVLIVFITLQRYMISGLTMGATKG